MPWIHWGARGYLDTSLSEDVLIPPRCWRHPLGWLVHSQIAWLNGITGPSRLKPQRQTKESWKQVRFYIYFFHPSVVPVLCIHLPITIHYDSKLLLIKTHRFPQIFLGKATNFGSLWTVGHPRSNCEHQTPKDRERDRTILTSIVEDTWRGQSSHPSHKGVYVHQIHTSLLGIACGIGFGIIGFWFKKTWNKEFCQSHLNMWKMHE